MECEKCGTKMELSGGWIPTYNDPDNSGLAPTAEPYCPQCDGDGDHITKDDGDQNIIP